MKSIKRAAAVLAATAVAATTFAVMSAPAHAQKPEGWYRCYVSGYGWMWCLDV